MVPRSVQTGRVARTPIDDYLDDVPEPGRGTLDAVRRSVLAVLPDAEECLSYGVPGFRVDGRVVGGFAAATHHLSWYPHSGSVLAALGDRVASYGGTKSALHFPHDEPLPADLVRALLEAKQVELRG